MAAPALPPNPFPGAVPADAALPLTGFSLRAVLLTAAACALLGALGAQLVVAPGHAPVFNPAAGIGLVAVLMLGRWALAGVAVAAPVIHLAFAYAAQQQPLSGWALALLPVAAALQAGLGAALVRRFVRLPLRLVELRDIVLFLALGGPMACLAGAAVSTAALCATGWAPQTQWPAVLLNVWMGDALGTMIVAPVALTMLGRPREDWQPRRSILGLTLVVSTGALMLGIAHVDKLDRERAHAGFETMAANAGAALSLQLQTPMHALQAMYGVMVSSNAITREQFRQAAHQWLAGSGEVHAIGWSERLRFQDIPAFEARAHADGLTDFKVMSSTGKGTVRPVQPHEEVVATLYIEPQRGNWLVLGVNSRANPLAGPVIDKAIRHGSAFATPGFPLRLPLDVAPKPEPGVVLYRAVYRGTPSNEEQRNAAAVGVVFVTMRLSEVMQALQKHVPVVHRLCLLDSDAPAGQQLLAGRPGCETRHEAFHYVRSVPYGGRHWELHVDGTRQDVNPEGGYAVPFAAAGLAGVAMLGAMLLAVTGRTRRIELAVAEAQQARVAAEQASRAKSEFLSRMSHELRTPLNAVLGFAQLLETDRREPLSPAHRPWVLQIQQGGWYLLEMINDVLDLSRIESDNLHLQLGPVELRPVLESALALVERAGHKRGITMRHEIAPEAAWVNGDATRLRQVLANLLSNAVKYNVEQGRIEVRARRVEQRIEIAVSDSGIGMTPDQLQQLFQPFNRLGRERTGVEGTGIGLVISRRLAEMMGGSLRAESSNTEGSTFVLALPAAAAPPPAAVREDERPPSSGYRRRTVHCVEDNPANVEVLRAILARREQLEVCVSTTGSEALQAMRAQPADLVLLDLNLPDVDALTVLQELKADPRTARIPVVVVSADALGVRIDAAMAAGAEHYLTKPVKLPQLLGVVDALLGEQVTRPAENMPGSP